jgi:hypothetical protein
VLKLEVPSWHLQFRPPETLAALPKRERPVELRRLFGRHMDALATGLDEAGVQVVRQNDSLLSLTIAATTEAVEKLREHMQRSHIDAVISPNDQCAYAC